MFSEGTDATEIDDLEEPTEVQAWEISDASNLHKYVGKKEGLGGSTYVILSMVVLSKTITVASHA